MSKLIIGLGNPGQEFESTPHNLGFQFLDQFRKIKNFSSFQFDPSLKTRLTTAEIDGIQIILAKPQTFMNHSGRAVKQLQEKFNLPPEDIWVIHDDLDIPFGEFKIVYGRGAAGHKGVASIIQYLDNQDFHRLRLGIKPKEPLRDRRAFVLHKFNFSQRLIVRKIIRQAIIVLDQELNTEKE
jgi:PTH1 family peptidyl-tRNA hydrolase